MNRRAAITVAVLVTAAVSACGDDPPSRADVLGEYGTEIAAPEFEGFTGAAGDVVSDVEAVCASSDGEAIEVAVESIDAARGRWSAAQAMATGPVMERRSPAVVDWPVRTADIEALIESSQPGEITADVMANNVGADTRGLSALRWVLTRDDVEGVLEDQRWCDYLNSTAAVVTDEADLLVGDWTESWQDGEPFVERLGDEDEADDWLEMIVNDNLNLVHKLTEAPDDSVDVPTDTAADRAAQLEGVAQVFGALGPLLGDELSERIDGEIEAARSAYADGDVDAGRELAAEIEATIATEVVARLDITVGFSDTDGDSAG
jgi:predicted lipoprotein